MRKTPVTVGLIAWSLLGWVSFASAYSFDAISYDEGTDNLTANIEVSTAEAQQWIIDSTMWGTCVGTPSTIKVFVNQSNISSVFDLDQLENVTDIPIGEGTSWIGFVGSDSDNCSWYSGDLFEQTIPIPAETITDVAIAGINTVANSLFSGIMHLLLHILPLVIAVIAFRFFIKARRKGFNFRETRLQKERKKAEEDAHNSMTL